MYIFVYFSDFRSGRFGGYCTFRERTEYVRDTRQEDRVDEGSLTTTW